MKDYQQPGSEGKAVRMSSEWLWIYEWSEERKSKQANSKAAEILVAVSEAHFDLGICM